MSTNFTSALGRPATLKPSTFVLARRFLHCNSRFDSEAAEVAPGALTAVVARAYTTLAFPPRVWRVAFIRRKGSSYYLVHNVRRQGKVKQLHLASLGERPRITDQVVRHVSRKHPLLELDWSELRQQANGRIELFDPASGYMRELARALRNLNLDLADLSPPLLKLGHTTESGHEIVSLLRLLRSTVEIKLDQFERARSTAISTQRRFR